MNPGKNHKASELSLIHILFEEKVIVVEDDAQIRSFVTYALEREGFKVIQAVKGEEALQCMVAENIDLMLLDLGLPDMDGMNVLRKLREWSEIPVIIVSARDQEDVYKRQDRGIRCAVLT